MNASEKTNNEKQTKVSQWIDRYVHDVIRHLPANQRSDIDQELRGLIDDLLQKRTGGGEPVESDVLAVLKELGAPRRLAGNYRGTPQYLIGPRFIDLYWLVLRIVLAAVTFGVIVAMSIQLVVQPPENVWQAFGDVFGSIWQSAVGAFGMVTLIFALNERYNHAVDAKLPNLDEDWKPADLPQITSTSLRIPRSEPIVSIVFTLILMVILNVNVDLIGAYFQMNGTWVSIPFFSSVLRDNLIWINVVLLLGIILESVKLIAGSWSLALAGLHFLLKIPGLILGVWLWSNPALLNPDFFARLGDQFDTDMAGLQVMLPDNIRRVVLFLIIFGFILDCIKPFVKSIRILLDKK
jgi:hypothetical protein